ncbi:subunit of TIM23 translocase complex [Borealophlyctis nickersoniae]|nr:subunit of TIM23 translocase complex [Borealophlyctis nickersoniae]
MNLDFKLNLPPWAEKMKMGFIMGGSAGMAVGFLWGSFAVMRGATTPGKGAMGTIGSTMLQHGAMLGFFLSIGSLLRSEEERALEYPSQHMLMRRSQLPIVIEPRRHFGQTSPRA